MADYYQLIAPAVVGLDKNTDEAWRAALYARARGALVIELCGVKQPLSDSEIDRECLLFDEAIRKIEANFTHRPSAAAVPVSVPTALEHPKRAPLMPEQGGTPIPARQPSAEAYTPVGSIPNSGNLEPSIEPPGQWIPSCVLPPHTNEVEPSMGVPAEEGINSYALDKPVAAFRHGSLWEFLDFEYAACRKDFAIDRSFPGEVFYRAADNVFLGRESKSAIVIARYGKVHKIYFGFTHVTEGDRREFLRDASDYFDAKYGPPSGTREIEWEQKTIFWDRDFGSLLLETNLFWRRNAIIYTSVRPRKRVWFGHILRKIDGDPGNYKIRASPNSS